MVRARRQDGEHARSARFEERRPWSVWPLDSKTIALAACGLLLAGVVAVTLNIMRQSESTVALRVRAALGRRLAGLRLGRMLARRGIGASTYLDGVTPEAARSEMSACETCAVVARCDAALESPAPPADLSFCPNDETMRALGGDRAANDALCERS